MPFLKRTGWGLSAVVVATGAALVLGCGREVSDGGSAREAVTKDASGQATGKASPIPQAGPLARPRSLHQVGLPAELTQNVIPEDNPQTAEKIALGQKLFIAHFGAILFHTLVVRDGILKRMVPWNIGPPKEYAGTSTPGSPNSTPAIARPR